MDQVVEGMAKAARENHCVLIGGETAEMPGMYHEGEYDISGTIVGVVERSNIIDGKQIAPGTVILGLKSTGLHTNGYSLARKALLEVGGYTLSSKVEGINGTVGEALATPHRSYLNLLIDLVEAGKIQGLVHITGSGFQGNIPRILPEGVDVLIDRSTWDVPALFRLIQKCGEVEENEMYSTFNMGLGMLVFVSPENAGEVRAALEAKGESVVECGKVVPGTGVVRFA
jgi:phosphoribosylformylglycinamidine cyclo-ligase